MKKRAGRKPCSKIVSTLFPRKIGWFEQRRVAQQHRRPQVISSVLPGRISLPKSDPFMALAAKGAVNSCAELDSIVLWLLDVRTQAGQCVLPRQQAVAFSCRPRRVGRFNGAIHPKTPARFAPGFSLRLLHEARRLAISRLRKRKHAQFRRFYFGRIRA
jgi:hypothetical protein